MTSLSKENQPGTKTPTPKVECATEASPTIKIRPYSEQKDQPDIVHTQIFESLNDDFCGSQDAYDEVSEQTELTPYENFCNLKGDSILKNAWSKLSLKEQK